MIFLALFSNLWVYTTTGNAWPACISEVEKSMGNRY